MGVLAVASVDKDDELDRARTSSVDDCIQRGARGAPGEKYVVNEDHVPVGQVVRDRGRTPGFFVALAVVAVGGYVDGMHGELALLDVVDPVGKCVGEDKATAAYPANL